MMTNISAFDAGNGRKAPFLSKLVFYHKLFDTDVFLWCFYKLW